MTDLQIFENTEFGKVKLIEETNDNDYIGYFYFLEWGNMLKIGYSKNPYSRLLALKRTAEKYANVKVGRFVLSKGHTNYVANEKILHTHFSKYRISDTELFDMTLETAISDFPKEVIYVDDSKEKEVRSYVFLENMKSLLFEGGLK